MAPTIKTLFWFPPPVELIVLQKAKTDFFSKRKKDTKKCNIKGTLSRCSGNNQQSIPLAFV